MILLGLRYSITNRTLNNIVEITRLAGAIAHKKIPAVVYRRIVKDFLAKTAHYSTKIEGNPLTLEQVKGLIDGGEVMAQRRAKNEVQNYVRVLENIAAYQSRGNIGLTDILKIHHDLTDGTLDNPSACGRRDVQNYVIAGSRIIYTPPPPEKVKAMMDELVSWINSDEARALHPVVQAGISHYAVVMIHPFEDGNGRVAKALATRILRIRGFDKEGIYAIDEYYEGDREAYYEALRKVDESGGDVTDWLEYYTEGILYSVKTIYDVIRSLELSEGLNPRQRRALKYVIKHGYITNREYRKINKVSNKTAYHDLKAMVEKGVFVDEGRGRAKKYVTS